MLIAVLKSLFIVLFIVIFEFRNPFVHYGLCMSHRLRRCGLIENRYVEEELVVLQLGEMVVQLVFGIFQLLDLGVFELDECLLVADERFQHSHVVLVLLHQASHQHLCNVTEPYVMTLNRVRFYVAFETQ